MDEVQIYALITTIAVCLLVLSQVIVLVIVGVVASRIGKTVRNIKQTSEMSKEFIASLREEQSRRGPLWTLGLYAIKKAQYLNKSR